MNVLIVSPAFPPFSGVGGMRMGSLVKYLKNKNINVKVLRNEPSIWGEENLKSEEVLNIPIIDVIADKSFLQNGLLYYRELRKQIQSDSIDLIIYSVGPFYTLIASFLVKKKYPEKKCIIDFRDLWSYEKKGRRDLLKDLRFSLIKVIYRIIERPAVSNSDAIVVVTPGDKAIMREKYKKKRKEIHSILNGYGEVEHGHISQNENRKEVLRIVSLGKLAYYAPQLANELMNAIFELKRETNINIMLIHVGQEESCLESAILNDDNTMYSCTGYVEYKEGMRITQSADIGVIVYNHPTGYGTKVFDYISCNKPVILITQDGKSLMEFVLRFKNGYVCQTKEQIKNAILDIYKKKIDVLDEKIVVDQYSREKQNQSYFELIKSVC